MPEALLLHGCMDGDVRRIGPIGLPASRSSTDNLQPVLQRLVVCGSADL